MTDLSYAHEKFNTGVHILAESPGRIQERLLDAYRGSVCRSAPPWEDPTDLPDDLRKRIEQLYARMTSEPGLGDGTIAATVLAMSEDDAVEVAQPITGLSYDLRRELEHQRGG